MRTDALDGNDLDYWCARALCADDEDTLSFTAVAPHVVVTAACDALRRLDVDGNVRRLGADVDRVRGHRNVGQDGNVGLGLRQLRGGLRGSRFFRPSGVDQQVGLLEIFRVGPRLGVISNHVAPFSPAGEGQEQRQHCEQSEHTTPRLVRLPPPQAPQTHCYHL